MTPTLPTDTIPVMNIGAFMKAAREAKGLRQKEVATSVGVSGASLSRFENGEHSLALEHLVSLAKLLEVSIDDAVGLPSRGSSQDGALLIPCEPVLDAGYLVHDASALSRLRIPTFGSPQGPPSRHVAIGPAPANAEGWFALEYVAGVVLSHDPIPLALRDVIVFGPTFDDPTLIFGLVVRDAYSGEPPSLVEMPVDPSFRRSQPVTITSAEAFIGRVYTFDTGDSVAISPWVDLGYGVPLGGAWKLAGMAVERRTDSWMRRTDPPPMIKKGVRVF